MMKKLPQKDVDYIVNGKNFYSLPLDIVASILSNISLKDIRRVRSTCVLFAQAMRKQHFWHRLIAQKLKQIIASNEKYKKYAVALEKYNTFESPVAENLREQVEWIFRKDWYTVFHGPSAASLKHVHFDRKTWKSTNLSNKFLVDTTTLVSVCWYESKNFNELDGDSHSIGKHPAEFDYCIVAEKKIIGKWKTKKGTVYEGQFILDEEKKFVEHGDGKWTFHDGTVLEGSGVAHMGEPRYILQKEEWESVSKKRKLDGEK